ncbi:MAG: ACP S-malonyltransferase [Chloroflexota bacterium]
MTSNLVVSLFPGQGAHAVDMLDGVRHAPAYAERYEQVSCALDEDITRSLSKYQDKFLNRNEVSSLLTVLVGSLSYDLWRNHEAPPAYIAGYSVGQWTGLYAANAISFTTLVDIVKTRALIMNECMKETPGGMIGVIGLKEGVIQNAVMQLQADGYVVEISNFNCLGQYSLAAAANAIQPTLVALQALEPRKVVELPITGAWHSSLLHPAKEEFAKYLETVSLASPQMPVIDNVTGQLLPAEMAELKRQLVKQISSPVRWQQGIETLIEQGCERFVEIGFGKLLTKFGFFIDRRRHHESFYN